MTKKRLTYTDFSDERIAAVLAGAPLTEFEREFLVTDTAHFEECSMTENELRRLSDSDLMREAYTVWYDYASGQI